MNDVYICSTDYIKPYHIEDGHDRLLYAELMYLFMAKDKQKDVNQINITVSERFEFLKCIELFNRKKGKIDRLTICAEMWPYGINLLSAGDPFEHWVKIQSFRDYPHEWDIDIIRLIGVEANYKLLDEKDTIATALLEIAEMVEYIPDRKFELDYMGNDVIGIKNKFDYVERN